MFNYESPQRTGSPCDDDDHTLQALFDRMTDYERGEYDCVHGHEALEGQSDKYNEGYGEQYAREQMAGAIR